MPDDTEQQDYEEIILTNNKSRIVCKYLNGSCYLGIDDQRDVDATCALYEITWEQRKRLAAFLLFDK